MTIRRSISMKPRGKRRRLMASPQVTLDTALQAKGYGHARAGISASTGRRRIYLLSCPEKTIGYMTAEEAWRWLHTGEKP